MKNITPNFYKWTNSLLDERDNIWEISLEDRIRAALEDAYRLGKIDYNENKNNK